MNQAITVFVSGIGGVFIGMTLLYLAILITPQITKRLEKDKEKEKGKK